MTGWRWFVIISTVVYCSLAVAVVVLIPKPVTFGVIGFILVCLIAWAVVAWRARRD